MGTQTTGGVIIAIGAAPATKDEAGFAAVAVEAIGEVTDIGEVGKMWSTATHSALAKAQVLEKKTSFQLQALTLPLAIDDTNQGQIDAKAANDTYLDYTIKITRQDGAVLYFTAQVSGFVVSFSFDSFENGTITLLPQDVPLPIAAP